MQKITILILFSLVMITLAGMALIPQFMIPDYDNADIIIKKSAAPNTKAGQNQLSTAAGCAASIYGLDCGITNYLEGNMIQPIAGGKVFCVYEKIGASESGDTTYLNYSCSEFYVAKGKIYEGSGQAGPAKITALEGGLFSQWIPRDGSYFARDIQESFPPEYQAAALNPLSEKMSLINRQRAQDFFKADFDYKIEKVTSTACSYDFECATPAEYLMMSRCPFTSKCVDNKCAIICPNITKIKQ